ncbi:hypothetical protein OS493_023394 [Desmophyllum pertusum]|uniref:Uncharacterized protein n=1 Tax=Desmophyllum pertusum TaxID=174260 RepID=A0A9W9ZZE7_9CNID|nr:hypothetical protein OS493_023394 [Desmophyllum pertusum]
MLKMNPRVTAFVLLVCLSGILAAHVPHQAVQDSEIFDPMTDDAAADMEKRGGNECGWGRGRGCPPSLYCANGYCKRFG